ncbi:hypothetical protein [Deinococcus peraridilitoris]|nr:hypothetical protein [Deinococcus peraridilitoris]
MTSSQNTLREALTAEGFRVEESPDSGLSFKYEGSTYFLPDNHEDPQFFQLLLPNFWSLETEDEYGRALLACDALNRHAKLVKVHTVENDTWVSVEAIHADPRHFLQFLPRYLSYIQDAVRIFRDQMLHSPTEDAPEDQPVLTTS